MAKLTQPISRFDTEIFLPDYPITTVVCVNEEALAGAELIKIVGKNHDKYVVIRGYEGTKVLSHKAGESVQVYAESR